MIIHVLQIAFLYTQVWRLLQYANLKQRFFLVGKRRKRESLWVWSRRCKTGSYQLNFQIHRRNVVKISFLVNIATSISAFSNENSAGHPVIDWRRLTHRSQTVNCLNGLADSSNQCHPMYIWGHWKEFVWWFHAMVCIITYFKVCSCSFYYVIIITTHSCKLYYTRALLSLRSDY